MSYFFKHGKQITARYNVSDLFTNGIHDLGQFFQRLEMQASICKISQLKVEKGKKSSSQFQLMILKKWAIRH